MSESTARVRDAKMTSLRKSYARPRLVERPILTETQANNQAGLDHFGTGNDSGPVIS